MTITGGKLTTFRRMAREVVDVVCGELGVPARSGTHGISLGLVAARADRAPGLLELVAEDPSLGEPLVPGLEPLAVEAVWAVRHEMAIHLDDVLARRLPLSWHDREAGLGSRAAGIVAAERGWSFDELDHQIDRYRRLVARERGPIPPPRPGSVPETRWLAAGLESAHAVC